MCIRDSLCNCGGSDDKEPGAGEGNGSITVVEPTTALGDVYKRQVEGEAKKAAPKKAAAPKAAKPAAPKAAKVAAPKVAKKTNVGKKM